MTIHNYRVPAAVRIAARHGLRLREQFGRGGTDVGVARARQLSSGSVPLADIRKMWAFFARHYVDARSATWANERAPSAGWIAWLLWGGDHGWKWVAEVLASEGIKTAAEFQGKWRAYRRVRALS